MRRKILGQCPILKRTLIKSKKVLQKGANIRYAASAGLARKKPRMEGTARSNEGGVGRPGSKTKPIGLSYNCIPQESATKLVVSTVGKMNAITCSDDSMNAVNTVCQGHVGVKAVPELALASENDKEQGQKVGVDETAQHICNQLLPGVDSHGLAIVKGERQQF